MALVKLSWNRRSVPEKLILGKYIIKQMTEHATVFTAPDPSINTVQAALDDLWQKTVEAHAGGYARTAAKKSAEMVFDGLIRQLAAYVQHASAGKERIILLSGMEVRGPASKSPTPPQVENLSAYPTRSTGEIQLVWDSLGRNYNYLVEQWTETENDEGYWHRIAFPSKSKFTVKELTTGTVYRFRVMGIGKDNTVGPASQEASSVAP